MNVMDDKRVAPVEVTVSKPCQHGAFNIRLGTRSVWRFHGMEAVDMEAEGEFHIVDDSKDSCDCN